jgi:antitoxin ParD1/3/4
VVALNTILSSKVNVMGMVKKSITLTEQQNEWLQSQLAVGKYASDSELLRDLIRKEQARHDEVNVIREALVAAEKSGLSKRTPADIMADVLANRSISGQL